MMQMVQKDRLLPLAEASATIGKTANSIRVKKSKGLPLPFPLVKQDGEWFAHESEVQAYVARMKDKVAK